MKVYPNIESEDVELIGEAGPHPIKANSIPQDAFTKTEPEKENTKNKKPSRLDSFSKFYEEKMNTMHNDRKNFIKKVYSLLTIQLIYTTGFVGVVVGVPELKSGIRETYQVAIACGVCSFVIAIYAFCCMKSARKYPVNYIILMLFTLLETYLVAFISSYYSSITVVCAAFITTGIALTLAIYTRYSRTSFSLCKGIMVGIFAGGCFFAISLLFTFNSIVNSAFALAGVVFYSIFLVYDLQLIAGGRYSDLTYDDYVVATIMLYIDIIGIFLYMLRVMRTSN